MAEQEQVDASWTEPGAGPEPRWFAEEPAAVVRALGSDAVRGLTTAEAGARLASHGQNTIEGEPPPSIRAVAFQQLRDPMNVMLVAVVVVSLVIGEVSTGVVVG